MSDLNDPRVLFAAERTLLAWSRTASGLMALGFFIDRTQVVVPSSRPWFALWIGLAFVLLGVALSAVSILQYRRSIAGLRPVEIPGGYWVYFCVWVSFAIGALGIALFLYLLDAALDLSLSDYLLFLVWGVVPMLGVAFFIRGCTSIKRKDEELDKSSLEEPAAEERR